MENLLGILSDLDLHGLAGTLHERGNLNSVTEHRVVGNLGSNNPANHLATVKSHTELEAVVWLVFDLKCQNLSQEVQSHLADLHRVVLAIGDGHPRGNHVGVTD